MLSILHLFEVDTMRIMFAAAMNRFILKKTFGRKGEVMVALNTNTAKAGYDFVKAEHAELFPIKITKVEKKQMLLGGAEAVGMGAIKAGLKFAAIYPMTPINTLMTYL